MRKEEEQVASSFRHFSTLKGAYYEPTEKESVAKTPTSSSMLEPWMIAGGSLLIILIAILIYIKRRKKM